MTELDDNEEYTYDEVEVTDEEDRPQMPDPWATGTPGYENF